MDICQIKECDRPAYAKCLCQAHYMRARAGKTLAGPLRKISKAATDQERIKEKSKINPDTGCWEWMASLTEHGYGQMRFQGTRWLSHRASWVAFVGPIPEADNAHGTMGVLHKCDNPKCVNPDHLFIGDQKTNSLDSVGKGRWGKRGVKGEKHGRAIITEDQVREIRASTESRIELAKKYGLSKSAVAHIQSRRSWAHVT